MLDASSISQTLPGSPWHITFPNVGKYGSRMECLGMDVYGYSSFSHRAFFVHFHRGYPLDHRARGGEAIRGEPKPNEFHV